MKKEKFERFKLLKLQGYKRPVISKFLDISLRTCDNWNKALKLEQAQEPVIHFPFNTALYYNLVLGHPMLTKDEIAKELGVTKVTLIKYEKQYIFHDFARFLKLNGYTDEMIKKTLHIKSDKELSEYLNDFVDLDTLINSIHAFKEYFDFKERSCNSKKFDTVKDKLNEIIFELHRFGSKIKV